MKRAIYPTLVLTAAATAAAGPAFGHGIIGKRFFPATLAVDDPFVADEFSLPTVTTSKEPASGEDPATRNLEISADFAKTITKNFGIEIGRAWIHQKPDGGDARNGWSNFETAAKYQFYSDGPSETVLSVGLGWEIGGSGAKRVGADGFNTLTPGLFSGKGFGDLPDSLRYLKPFAVTAALGIGIPLRSSTSSVNDDGELEVERHPDTIEWGFAVEYSLSYLQSFVEDAGLGAPFNRMIPLVEFAFSTPIDRGGGVTTGTVNPGVLWAGQSFQLGFEMLIPVNERSGTSIGARAQLHFFLDDLFPATIGRPLFGN